MHLELRKLIFQIYTEYSASFERLAKKNYKMASSFEQVAPYSTSSRMWDYFVDEIKELRPQSNTKIVAVSSKESKLEAAASFSEKSDRLILNLLATNPKNLGGCGIRGSATFVMLEIIKISKALGKPIYLESSEVARSFYERLGFVSSGQDYMVLVV